MKLFLVALTLLIIAVGLSCKGGAPPDVAYVPTPGEAATISFDVDEVGAQKHKVVVWPTEISFGDPVYIVSFDENASSEPIRCFQMHFPADENFPGDKIATSSAVQGEYHWSDRRAPWILEACIDYAPDRVELKPGEKLLYSQRRLEFPPLQSMDDPFWKAFEEAMPPEGLTCRLAVVVDYRDSDNEVFKKTLTQDIHIKPRPREERELLAKWFEETKSKLPTKDAKGSTTPSDYPSEYDLDARGADDVRIGWSRFNPWLFIPYGYRKPSIPNCPTTLDGWRELEAILAPSTMRDEIRLVRLQLEYYAADDGEATERAKEELISWLADRPVAQRATMTMGVFDLPWCSDRKFIMKRQAFRVELSKRLPSDDILK